MKKRVVSTMLAAAMAFSLFAAGCGSKDGATASNGNSGNNASASEETGGTAAPSEGAQTWNIGSSSSGTFYYVATAMGQILSTELADQGLTIVGEATNGGVENARRLNSGELSMAICGSGDMALEIEAGNVDADNVTLIGGLWENIWQTAAQPDLGWKTLDDAMHAGLKVGIGEPGAGLQNQWKQMAAIYDLTIDDLAAEQIGTSDFTDKMIDGELEVCQTGGVLPNSTISNLASSISGGIQLLNWSEENITAINEYDPYIILCNIPGGTYTGTDEDITSAGVVIPLYARADLDEDLVYEFTKAMFESAEEMGKIYDACAQITPETALTKLEEYEADGIKLHPGAERYYKEIGLID